MENNFQFIFNRCTQYTVFIPLLIGLLVYKKISRPYFFLFYLIVLGACTETINSLLSTSNHIRLVLNFYTIGEMTLIAMVYLFLIQEVSWRKWIKITLIVVNIFFLINMLFIEGWNRMNSISMDLECIFLLILSAKVFYDLILNVPTQSLKNRPEFWFNMAVFVYFSINFFLFLISDKVYLKRNKDLLGFSLWQINNIANVFFNTFFTISLWKARKNKSITSE